MSTDLLRRKQNSDGGWPYVRGASWTEPTVYAILALHAEGEREAVGRGVAWLRKQQNADGGWPPQIGFDESTWVTALAALLPPELLGAEAHGRAIAWLLSTEGEETKPVYRMRQWLMGIDRRSDSEFAGWPWVPGSAAWVGPTSLGILALEKEYRRKRNPALGKRIEDGRNYLLRRMCSDGGWNHGSIRALGYESAPYPETTGMALAALRGVRMPAVSKSIAVARKFLAESRSADACNWLCLGLLAHGELEKGYSRPEGLTCHTLPEASLSLVVGATLQGREPLWA